MQFVDSHCHLDRLDLTPFDGSLEQAINDAREAGVCHILSVCVQPNEMPNLHAIADQHADISLSVGLHPSESTDQEPTTETLLASADHPKVIAIGETGLDYHYDAIDRTLQQSRFRAHIRASVQSGKPLIIHSRDAREDTIRILKEEGAEQVGGVMHCFTENEAMAEAAMAMNFYISFSGILTFKNAHELQALGKKLPLDRILIETDAPYLTPVPYRGKPNRPAYVREVACFLANLRGVPVEQIAAQTSQNFFTCFKLR